MSDPLVPKAPPQQSGPQPGPVADPPAAPRPNNLAELEIYLDQRETTEPQVCGAGRAAVANIKHELAQLAKFGLMFVLAPPPPPAPEPKTSPVPASKLGL